MTIYPPITNPPTINISSGEIITLAADIMALNNFRIDSNVPVGELFIDYETISLTIFVDGKKITAS